MHLLLLLSLLVTFRTIDSHSDHAQGGNKHVPETNEQYAQRHMTSEHHIDSFDIKAFFHLHDLNRDGFWDREEIEAIYGVHHVYSQKLSPDDRTHQEKADVIVQAVLGTMDKNKDGKLSPAEVEAAGLNALPNFKDIGAEGHHYDVESEFFLHHEEVYHSTPETQTDEAYNHPEDLEHFALHGKIEAEEEARERRFQGLAPNEPLSGNQRKPSPSPPAGTESAPQASGTNQHDPLKPYPSQAAHPHDDQKAFSAAHPVSEPPEPKVTFNREVPPEKQPPEVRFGKSAEEGRRKDEWGQGEDGYKRPKTPADKMRRNLPYKYKFRRNWGDF